VLRNKKDGIVIVILILVLLVTAMELASGASKEQEKKENQNITLKVKKGWTLFEIAQAFNSSVEEITELNDIENPDLIYVGQRLKIPYNKAEVSWYGPRFHGNKMANGEKLDMHDTTVVAHRLLPFGTRIKLTKIKNKDNEKKSVIVVVQDRGPYIKGRHFDLSRGAAKKLDIIEKGTAECKWEVLKKSSKNK